MKKLFFVLVIGLASCSAMDRGVKRGEYFSGICTGAGFQVGTPEYARCVQNLATSERPQ